MVHSKGRTIFVADAHRDGNRLIVRADEKLAAFLELASSSLKRAQRPRGLGIERGL
jgi:hypothetical protein